MKEAKPFYRFETFGCSDSAENWLNAKRADGYELVQMFAGEEEYGDNGKTRPVFCVLMQLTEKKEVAA